MTRYIYLETQRLILREFDRSDVQSTYRAGRNPNVTRFLSWHHASEKEAEEFIEKTIGGQQEFPRQNYGLAIVLQDSQEHIGGCGLHICRDWIGDALLGYWLSEEAWGQGYTTEAIRALLQFGFEELNLRRICALCCTQNTASYKVLEKNGMEREGLLRKNFRVGTEWLDHYLYARLRESDLLKA